MGNTLDQRERIQNHPCYCEAASYQFARVHLPVAPKCNLQCNYCHRSYDCANECRPGITRELLSPQEALQRVTAVKTKIPQLSVVGIAGPGDPLANPAKTFETFRLVGQAFPEMQLCLSTNGLTLPGFLDELEAHKIGFVTVTVNAVDPEIGDQIYAWVLEDGIVHRGPEAAALVWSRQKAGIQGLVSRGIIVKVNTVLIPGINDSHVLDIAREMRDLGVFLFNIMPLIPLPQTPFEHFSPPSAEQRRQIVQACMPVIKIMRHCQQCRADAVGFLGEDRSEEFTKSQAACLISGRSTLDD